METRNQEKQASDDLWGDIAAAYTDGRIVGDSLVECFRPEGIEHLSGLPDYMGLIAEAINEHKNDANRSACLHGTFSSFVRELIRLNRANYKQDQELKKLKSEIL